MNHKSITPNPQQPVDRVPTGQLPSALAELSEATLSAEVLLPSAYRIGTGDKGDTWINGRMCVCSYDGDDE